MKELSKPTLLFVRHGSTVLNEPGNEKLRGMLDPKLDDDGIKDAHRAAEKVAEYPLHHIYAGPLKRTMKTAQIISKHTGAAITPTPALDPWDYGEMTGKPVNKENLDKLTAFQEKPTQTVPGGEAYAEFYKRFADAVDKATQYVHSNPSKALLLCTHSRNLYPLKSILGDQTKPIPVHEKTYEPGSVWKVEFNPAAPYGFTMEKI